MKKTTENTGMTDETARIYEEFFVPALLAEWVPKVAAAAGVKEDDRVLDVACGTGLVAKYMKDNKGADVTAVDINESMLSVAVETGKNIKWIEASAESLPFDDNSFNAVTCQFGLMFFDDRVSSLKEMKRVLKPGGKAAVAVWDKIDTSPGYSALYNLIYDQFGKTIAITLRHPFVLGEIDLLNNLFKKAGFDSFEIKTLKGTAVFPSIKSWIRTEVRGWVFSDLVSDEELLEFIRKAETALKHLTDETGKVKFKMSVHIVSAKK